MKERIENILRIQYGVFKESLEENKDSRYMEGYLKGRLSGLEILVKGLKFEGVLDDSFQIDESRTESN